MSRLSLIAARASRRDVLRLASAGGLGLSLPNLLRLRADEANSSSAFQHGPGFGRAKSCIVLFCWGGMSQLESWDPKPEAPVEVRGEYKAIDTATPGVQIGEYLPKLAEQTGKLAIVRSCTHRARDHRQAAYWTMTGVPPIQLDGVMVSNPVLPTRDDKPSLGAMVGFARGGAAELPRAVTLPYPIAERGLVGGQHAGFLGVEHDPLIVRPPAGTPFPGVSPLSDAPDFATIDDAMLERMQGRRELLRSLHDDRDGDVNRSALWDHFHDYAVDMLSSPQVKQAFQLESEPASVHDAYGPHIFGQSVLLARRLAEAGVPLVTVNCGAGDLNGGIGAIWDTHFIGFPNLKDNLMPPFDQAASALLGDLADRGTLDETLVVLLTEFGRQPLINQFAGRDHQPDCYSVAFAGGGVVGGQVMGRSNRLASEVEEFPVGPADLHATIFHALGIDPLTPLTRPNGETLPLSEGTPLTLF
jgi:hypothetical protein